MINADERQLYKTYEEVIGPQSNIYVADSKGRIVSSNRDTLIGLSYFNMNNLETMFAGEDHIITKISERILFLPDIMTGRADLQYLRKSRCLPCSNRWKGYVSL